MKPASEPISVSTKEASKLTGIPPSTLRDMAKRGEFKSARRVGDKSWVWILTELRDEVNRLPPVHAHPSASLTTEGQPSTE